MDSKQLGQDGERFEYSWRCIGQEIHCGLFDDHTVEPLTPLIYAEDIARSIFLRKGYGVERFSIAKYIIAREHRCRKPST